MPLRELTRDVVGSFQRHGLVLAAWVLTSIGFGLYVTYVASYGSVFSHLASVFVLLLHLWLLANAFLVGIQLDACIRERA